MSLAAFGTTRITSTAFLRSVASSPARSVYFSISYKHSVHSRGFMKTSFLADPLKLQIPPTKKMGVEYKRVEYKHKYKQEPFISYYQVRTSETENR